MGIYHARCNEKTVVIDSENVARLPLNEFILFVRFEQSLAAQYNTLEGICIVEEANGNYEFMFNPEGYTRFMTEAELNKYTETAEILTRWKRKTGTEHKTQVKGGGCIMT